MEKKNPLDKFIAKILYPACFFFTICVFVFALIATLGGASNIVPGLAYMGLLFLFSLCLAALNRLFSTSLSTVLQVTLHFIGTLAAFFVVFILCGGYYKSASSALILTLFFILVYILILSVVMLIRSLSHRRKNDKSDYNSQFKS